jgi:glycosyltransferase involved in cell wall biosynthesis
MLRGIAIDQADGDFICQWDDDDLYHPTRIERQVEAMLKADARASYLADYLHLFQDAKKVFLCDWKCGLPGTLLAYKEGLPIFDDSLSVDEDTDLQRRLIRAGISVAVVRGLGLLYVYTFHGGNSFSHAHHLRTALSTARNATEVLSTVPALCCALRDHRLEPPLSIVDNRGKIIFEWSATVDSSVE